MKVAILVTLYTTEDQVINQYVRQVYEAVREIQYKPTHLVVGKHRISNRPHTHIHFIAETEDAKIYKSLESKLRRTYAMKPEKIVVKYNISINYDDGEKDKKGHMFSEEAICSYPLKEYDSKNMMVDDLLHIELSYVFNQINDYEPYRIFGHTKWVSSDKFKKEEYNNEKKEFKEGLYIYLDQVVITSSIELTNIAFVIRYVCKHILAHYKSEGKCFNPMQLKAQALNYLYITDKVTEEQICDYLLI